MTVKLDIFTKNKTTKEKKTQHEWKERSFVWHLILEWNDKVDFIGFWVFFFVVFVCVSVCERDYSMFGAIMHL